MADGTEVRNIDDLKAHFNIGAVVKHFKEGNLLTWLEDRYYDEEAEAIKKISLNDEDLEQKLSVIFGIEPPEEIARRAERLNRLKNYTADKNILANVDKVAFDQEDLADLLDEGTREIYLCANRFVIPLRMKNKTYIGVSEAVAIIRSKNPVDFGELGIKFKNITFDDDYQKILDASIVKPEPPKPSSVSSTPTYPSSSVVINRPQTKSASVVPEPVIRILKEQLQIEKEDIQMSSNLVNDLGADSLDLVELIMAFEEEYNVEIPDDVAEKMRTGGDIVVGDIVKYIERNS